MTKLEAEERRKSLQVKLNDLKDSAGFDNDDPKVIAAVASLRKEIKELNFEGIDDEDLIQIAIDNRAHPTDEELGGGVRR